MLPWPQDMLSTNLKHRTGSVYIKSAQHHSLQWIVTHNVTVVTKYIDKDIGKHV